MNGSVTTQRAGQAELAEQRRRSGRTLPPPTCMKRGATKVMSICFAPCIKPVMRAPALPLARAAARILAYTPAAARPPARWYRPSSRRAAAARRRGGRRRRGRVRSISARRQHGRLGPAARDREGAARVEMAARRRIERARQVGARRVAMLAPPCAAADRGAGSRPAACAYRDGRGRRTASSVGAVSTMRPRYITATRSAMCFTTARSCAMNR